MMKTIRIGPVGLPSYVLFLLIAYTLALFVLYLLKYKKEHRKQINNITITTLLIIFIVWKFSPLITSFSTVSKNLKAILYLPGSTGGLIAAFMAAAVYVAVKLKKAKGNLVIFSKGLSMSFGIIIIASTLLAVAYSFVTEKEGSSVSEENAALLLHNTEGQTVNLARQRDKILVLNFWASWCPPCRAEIPELNHLYQSKLAAEIYFYTINLTSTEPAGDTVTAFMQQYDISFPVLLDTTGKTANFFNVKSVPTTIILDKKGEEVIRYENAVTEDILVKKIKRLRADLVSGEVNPAVSVNTFKLRCKEITTQTNPWLQHNKILLISRDRPANWSTALIMAPVTKGFFRTRSILPPVCLVSLI